ncbi:hypothetical protein BOX15_Mlig006070g2, partial [Macrostomum lignano]
RRRKQDRKGQFCSLIQNQSMDLLSITVGLLAVLAVGWLISYMSGQRRLPPGPPVVPVLGSFPFMKFPLRNWLRQAKQRYGAVCSFQLNGRQVVFLNTYEAVKEAFVTQGALFSGRPRHIFSTRVMGNSGLVMTDGPSWKRHRRFSLQVLRDCGFGKIGSEDSIVKEALELAVALEETRGQPVSTGNPFGKAVSNVICMLVFGRRLATEDPTFDEKLALINKITQQGVSHPTLRSSVLVPLLTSLAPNFLMSMEAVKKSVKLFDEMFTFCQDEIEKKRSAYNLSDEPADYIEAYLAERNRIEQRDPSEAAEFYGDKKLQVSIADLFMAGTDTTSNSLRWAALHLAKDQQMQDRLFKHVRDCLGGRPPTMSDRSRLPLIEAFLLESQRVYTLIPGGVAHRAIEDTELFGYLVPKNCNVMPNIEALHSDPEVFPEPEKFRIERFIDANGKFAPSERVIPFSIGKRSCLGESLARMELFIFAIVIIQRFRIELPDDEASKMAEILEGTPGTVKAPAEHKLMFKLREE